MADYAIKHVLSDFDDNSQVWRKVNKQVPVYLNVVGVLVLASGLALEGKAFGGLLKISLIVFGALLVLYSIV